MARPCRHVAAAKQHQSSEGNATTVCDVESEPGTHYADAKVVLRDVHGVAVPERPPGRAAIVQPAHLRDLMKL